MRRFVDLLVAVILLLSTGCAAPMTQVVATRLDGIDQQRFKEDDEVWITYKDEGNTYRKVRGRVIHTDSSSVRLRRLGWEKDPIAIDYRRIATISHPVKNGWIMGVSAGRFRTEYFWPNDDSKGGFTEFRSVGFSPRYAFYSSQALEMNFLVGRAAAGSARMGVGPWIGTTLNYHAHLVIPGTYGFLGVGFMALLSKSNSEHLVALHRWGLGLKIPLFSKLNVRLELEVGDSSYKEYEVLGGFKICFERKFR